MRVLIAAGASGGHIFPALSLAECLKEKNNEVLLVLPERSRVNVQIEDIEVKYTSITNLVFKLSSKNIYSIFNFIKGFFETLFIFSKFKPDTVVGFGTIDCMPAVILGWLFRASTIIHEQNVIPGSANKALSIISDKIAISFSETSSYLKANPNKIIFTGNPLRRALIPLERQKALSLLGLKQGKFTVLAMGGSQGSRSINKYFVEAVSRIPSKDKYQFIHLTGRQDYDFIAGEYKRINVDVVVYPFFNDMQYVYSASDLAVCRSGATTVAELSRFSLPAILVPYPYAHKHQLINAKVLQDQGVAVIVEEKDFINNSLSSVLSKLLDDTEKIIAMRFSYDNLRTQGKPEELLAKIIMELN